MIAFDKEKRIFKIETRNTVYAMQIVHDKFAAHLYYGKKTDGVAADYVERAVDFAPYVAEVGIGFSLETTPTELSFLTAATLEIQRSSCKMQTGIVLRCSIIKTIAFSKAEWSLTTCPIPAVATKRWNLFTSTKYRAAFYILTIRCLNKAIR